jgi:predicted lipoprotein with Yx(FWY)xxD motif
MMKNTFLKKRHLLVSLGLLVVLILAACQPEPAAPPAADTPVPMDLPEPELPAEVDDPAAASVTISVAVDPALGEILVDEQGMTLYMFTQDGPDQANCTDGCLQAWPPLLAEGGVNAGAGVDPALIGETGLVDGRRIVTYNGMPLYYWAGDAQPGDVTGLGVNDEWFVVSPQGDVVGMEAPLPVTGLSADVVTVEVATHPTIGRILVDSEGMTLYMFTLDEPDQSNCLGDCLQAWPPLLTEGDVAAGEGMDADLLGIAELADGSRIVTYNRMPLYYWVGDTRPGDANGQDVNNVWFVVSPDGKPVGAPSQSDAGSGDYSYPDY